MTEKEASIEPAGSASESGWLRNYLPMAIGQIISLLGSALVQFALVWYETKTTGSAAVLATTTTAALIPNVVLGPFAGALVDRWDRKLVMIIADLIVAMATAILAALFAFGAVQFWHIVLTLLIRSTAGVFQGPARTAATTLMVPKEHLGRIGGVNQAVDGIMNVFSPAMGALMIELMPIQGVLAVDIITAALAIALLIFFVRVPKLETDPETEHVAPKTVLADVRDAVRYVLTWPGLLLMILMASLLNMFLAPAGSLLPLHVTAYFGKGAQELAWLQITSGVGSIVGGLLLGVWGGFKRKVWTVMIGIVGIGAGMLAFGLVPADRYSWSLIVLGTVGLMSSLANGSIGPLFQVKVPPEMQGRVFTLLSSLAVAMMPIGLFFAAPIADRLGMKAVYILGGTACILISVFGMLDKRIITLDLQKEGGALMTEEEINLPSNPRKG